MKKLFITILILLPTLLCLALPIHGAEATTQDSTATEQAADTPVLSGAILAFFEENGGTLLSAAGVLTSLLLAFLYKSGLLPLVSRGLSAISESSDKASGIAADFAKKAADTLSALESSASSALNRAEEAAAIAKSTEALLAAFGDALNEAREERARIALVLAEETALFYELLNSVKLPESQKEVIRKQYYEYRALLEQNETKPKTEEASQ